MSSHRISASGDRQYSLTAGGGQFTACQFPSKQDDEVIATINSFGEIQMILPSRGVELRRLELNGSIYNVLVLKAEPSVHDGEEYEQPSSVTIHARPGQQGRFHPHTNLDARKVKQDGAPIPFLSEAELVSTFDLAIPPTEVS